MKRILIVIEATDYAYINAIKPPNLMKLNPHPALSFGLGSRPSVAGLLGGMLPVCEIPYCYHRDIKEKWSNPFFLTTIRKLTEKQFYLCPNGWALEMLLPWMDEEQRRLNFYWHDHHEILPAKEMTDYFLKNKGESYFALLWYFCTHYPFYSPKGHDRREAHLYVDEQIGRVLNECSDAEIVVCSDHNLPPRVVSAATDVPSPNTMKGFIASNFREAKEWGVNVHELAKKEWLSPRPMKAE